MKSWLLRAVLLLTSAGLAGAAEETSTPAPFEIVRLGTTRAALQERFGEALRTIQVVIPRSPLEQIYEVTARVGEEKSDTEAIASEARDPFANQERLGRSLAQGELRSAEYDLFQGRVYRTRWRFDERFERPLMPALVAHLRERLGDPDYDQTIEAKVGSGKSDLRRTGWRRNRQAFEVRQLHPFNGGPLFVSLSDLEALNRIVSAEGVALPQPDSTGAWWSRPQRELALATRQEREELLRSMDALVAKIGFEQEANPQ